MVNEPYRILHFPKHTFDRIAFYGPMAVGKSWCASYLRGTYMNRSLAGKLKSIAHELYGISGKGDEARRILQELGMDIRRHDHDVWVKYLLNEINTVEDNSRLKKFTIDDMRFVNEAKWLRENGFILVLVTCDERIRQLRIKELYPDLDIERQNHRGEKEWQEIEPDFVVDSTTPAAGNDIERIITNVTYRPRWEGQRGKVDSRRASKKTV